MPVLVALAVLGALFDPAGLTARETLLPAAADAAQWRLIRLNGLHEGVFGLAYLVGPGIGGVLIGAVGAAGTLWASAAAFAVSVGLVACVRVPGAGRPPRRPRGVWRATGEGLRFVWRDRLLRTLALLNVAIVALYLPVEGVILPAQFVADAAPERLGLVVMAMSAGGLAGALGFGTVGHRLHRRAAFITAVLGSCTALLAMAALPPFPVLVALAAVVGLLYGPVGPLVNTAMQIRTPERLRGRVVGVMTSVACAAGPAGYLVAGPLVEAFGPRGRVPRHGVDVARRRAGTGAHAGVARAGRARTETPRPRPARPGSGIPTGTPPPEGPEPLCAPGRETTRGRARGRVERRDWSAARGRCTGREAGTAVMTHRRAPRQPWDMHLRRLYVLSLARRRAVNLGTTGPSTSSIPKGATARPGRIRARSGADCWMFGALIQVQPVYDRRVLEAEERVAS